MDGAVPSPKPSLFTHFYCLGGSSFYILLFYGDRMGWFDYVYVDLQPIGREFGPKLEFQTKGLSQKEDIYRITAEGKLVVERSQYPPPEVGPYRNSAAFTMTAVDPKTGRLIDFAVLCCRGTVLVIDQIWPYQKIIWKHPELELPRHLRWEE